MKKTLAFITLTLLVNLAAGAAPSRRVNAEMPITLLTHASAWSAEPQAAQTQPTWGSTEEYNAWKAASDATDPNKKVELAEAFMKKYPNSPFVYFGYIEEIKAYQALGQGDKAMQAAVNALKLSPENLDALSFEAFALPYVFKPNDSSSAEMLARAQSDSKKALDLLQKIQKPANVTDDQFNQFMKGKRALFNSTLGYGSLQNKDYAGAITYLKAAAEDNPSDNLTFSMLGQAYVNSTPPDYDNGIWNLARSVALAKAANAPNAAALQKYYDQVYVSRHGSDEGEQDVIAQASAAATPPAGFKVTPAEKHKPTGKPAIDFFYETEDTLKAGGAQAPQYWSQVKGQEYQSPGKVVSADKAPSGDASNVAIAITDEGKAKDTPEIILRTKQPDAKFLAKGDLVTSLKGTIAEYTLTPSFALTLDGTIDDDSLAAAKEKRAKEKAKAKPKPRPRTAARHTKTTGSRPKPDSVEVSRSAGAVDACGASAACALAPLLPVIEAEFLDLSAECVAVDAQGPGGSHLVALVQFQNLPNKSLLEFAHRVLKGDSVFDHLVDEGVKLLFHGRTPDGWNSPGFPDQSFVVFLSFWIRACLNFSNSALN
jgi:tetratricopeptide (TPR) repeat protein